MISPLDADYRSPRPIPDEVELELGGFREWLAVVGSMTSPQHEGLAVPKMHRPAQRR
jgi:hypothetical protein